MRRVGQGNKSSIGDSLLLGRSIAISARTANVPSVHKGRPVEYSFWVSDVWAALGTAELAQIVGLSLTVSFFATAIAAVLGLPCGATLAICRFPGRRLLILLANAFLGLPPVVVGLALYPMLSRSGPWVRLRFSLPQAAWSSYRRFSRGDHACYTLSLRAP
jgi:ABC-type Fe3+ transport system permease subunit